MTPMTTALISLLSLILGTLLGGMVKAVQDRYVVFREGQAVAGALRAEIEALTDVIRRRKYVDACRNIVTYLSDETREIGPDSLIEIKVTQHYFQVFDQHCNKIGLLGSAAASVVSWYTLGKALVEDLRYLPERHRSANPLSRKQLISMHDNIREMFEDLLKRGTEATEQLAQHERKRFMSVL
jgi:hypothetical protein